MAGTRWPTCRDCSRVGRAHKGCLIDDSEQILRRVRTDHSAGPSRLGPTVLLMLAHALDVELGGRSIRRLLRSLAHLVAIGSHR